MSKLVIENITNLLKVTQVVKETGRTPFSRRKLKLQRLNQLARTAQQINDEAKTQSYDSKGKALPFCLWKSK